MSKQTAVEFLLEEFSSIFGKLNFTAVQGLLLKDALEKAKEMEKEQIMQSYNDGKGAATVNYKKNMSLEQYYNETFKNESK